jgi:hypothetical protein
MESPPTDLKYLIADRVAAAPADVWTPVDFLDLGSREAVDKALQRLAAADVLRRIDRGLYDSPRFNPLTGKASVPDYRRVIDAIARRDQTRMLVDGMTAANDLGLSDAVPGRIVVHADARLRPVHIGKQTITFRPTSPSKLYWAGRPAMRVVQALHWLREALAKPEDRQRLIKRLHAILGGEGEGASIAADLRLGLPTLPTWMQELVRELLTDSAGQPRARRRRVADDGDHHARAVVQHVDRDDVQQQPNTRRRSRPRADHREAPR